jgi:hypothetical protein
MRTRQSHLYQDSGPTERLPCLSRSLQSAQPHQPDLGYVATHFQCRAKCASNFRQYGLKCKSLFRRGFDWTIEISSEPVFASDLKRILPSDFEKPASPSPSLFPISGIR